MNKKFSSSVLAGLLCVFFFVSNVNKSFEWTEIVNDGKWAPTKGEQVVDMGIRGMQLKLL